MLRRSFSIPALGWVLASSVLAALPVVAGCSGTIEHIPADDRGSGGATGGSGGASGGQGTGGSTPSGGAPSGGAPNSGGTGGRYVDRNCPDTKPPAPVLKCDPLNPYVGCAPGEGCYPYVTHPFGSECSFQQFGAVCAKAGTGIAGDYCGTGYDDCAPGYLCVVGAGAGTTCQKICPLTGDPGCEPGLLCGETDIEGYGICF